MKVLAEGSSLRTPIHFFNHDLKFEPVDNIPWAAGRIRVFPLKYTLKNLNGDPLLTYRDGTLWSTSKEYDCRIIDYPADPSLQREIAPLAVNTFAIKRVSDGASLLAIQYGGEGINGGVGITFIYGFFDDINHWVSIEDGLLIVNARLAK